MKKSLIFRKTNLVMLALAGFVFFFACKKDDSKRVVDCSTVTGATFTSNSGKLATLLESKCGTTNCHAVGGAGSIHWEWEANYDTLQPHFEHMLEAVEEGSMPEAGSAKLTDGELDLLACWKEAGFPE